ncbi:glycine--tRNA ligase [Candidatus Nomurabacteria bacterium]|nr:glycine--tRNA ligase [Candidatus Nomurabacteria bacterium]
MAEDIMQKIVSLCKRRGFVFPGSEIYGGLANSWDYGPLGAQLKKNIKDDWWKQVVESRDDMVGLDGAILMNPKVWEASGHVSNFNDPLVEDIVTHKRYRADHVIEEWLEQNGDKPFYLDGQLVVEKLSVEAMSLEQMSKFIADNGITSPDKNELSEPKQFNLMFATHIGPTSDSGNEVYMRPETAQAIFVNFKNVINTSRKRVPFGIAQIGKAFRNEITPGNFTFRTLEFEQMEIEYFIEENGWEAEFEKWENWMQNWAQRIGLDMEKVSKLNVPKEELAHYSKKTIDFEFDFPFGKKELWGLAYRTNFDLTNHMNHSGEKMEFTDPMDTKRKYIPHVIEPSLGVDRTMLAILASAYCEEEVPGESEGRIVMKFAPHMAPYQVAVLPLMKKDGLEEKAQEVFDLILPHYRAEFDVSGSIGKRYRRQDEIGTPLCITVDHDTLQDGSVTVRDRDTMEQKRVPIEQLLCVLAEHLST